MRQNLFRELAFIIVLTIVVVNSGKAAEQADQKVAFQIRGVHQFLYPSLQQKLNSGKPAFEQFSQRLKLLAKLDYNLVIFGIGNAYRTLLTLSKDGKIEVQGGSVVDLKKLIKQAIKLNIEPVFGMKFIGKPNAIMRELENKYPGLLVNPKNKNTIVDPTFRLSGASSSYSGTYLKIIDFLTALYPANHPPKYFLLGTDEFISDDMATVSKKLKLTPPQAFAFCLDIGTTYLLNKGITPIIWGDCLLSPTLGTSKHGITLPGYRADPRLKLKFGFSYHSAFRGKDYQLHQVVNFMQNRNKIIVADWHYRPSSTDEFPSVDYFQQMGFKDVWGATWNKMTNIQQFSHYAYKRKCGGMLATLWNNYTPMEQLNIQQILYNNSAYFHDPQLPLYSTKLQFSISDYNGKELVNENSTGLVPVPGKQLRFRAFIPTSITPKAMELFIFCDEQNKYLSFPLKFDRKKQQLSGDFSIPTSVSAPAYFGLEYGFADTKTNFYYLCQGIGGFKYGKSEKISSKAPAKSLFYVDFSKVDVKTLGKLWSSGKCNTLIMIQKKSSTALLLTDGGINCANSSIWAKPIINTFIAKGFKIAIEAKMTGKFSGDYCALLTQGNFFNGFRILIRKSRKVLFQFGGLGNNRPLDVYTKKPFPVNRWTKLEINYQPSHSGSQGSLTIKLDGENVGNTRLSKPMIIDNESLLGIGCEPNGLLHAGRKLIMRRPNFPGIIRKLNVSTL